MFRAPGLTAVAVASTNNYTAVFLGTATGRLLKVSVCDGNLPGVGHRRAGVTLFSSVFPPWLHSGLSQKGGPGLRVVRICCLNLLAWGLFPVAS